jgi:hypothetical protein
MTYVVGFGEPLRGGAGEGTRTLVFSLGSLRGLRISAVFCLLAVGKKREHSAIKTGYLPFFIAVLPHQIFERKALRLSAG